ncbi:unnamed protein product [Paramecium octaurelia]|uniref:Uncharacterized protein n=1 Tax=Paramecium octaurelia TaxID=43137 RepID=A0A8S1W010_PAROT|nr:unnamed protein product [Paramecium octaurelia]
MNANLHQHMDYHGLQLTPHLVTNVSDEINLQGLPFDNYEHQIEKDYHFDIDYYNHSLNKQDYNEEIQQYNLQVQYQQPWQQTTRE